MNTKIFCDIADLSSIKKFNKLNIVKGFTTNPSLMRKAGAKDYKSYSKLITCPGSLFFFLIITIPLFKFNAKQDANINPLASIPAIKSYS